MLWACRPKITKTVNINLNGNEITAPERVFLVEGGTLNLTGKGTIKEKKANYGAIVIKGSTNPSDNNYSVVNIGKDIEKIDRYTKRLPEILTIQK